MICISIGNPRHKMMIAEHRALAEQGAELVEMRLDWLARLPKLHRLLNDRPTPIVITCRRTSDGGRWSGTEEQRLTLLRAAIVDQADYVDLEDDIAERIPRYGKTQRIISHHNFDETPDDLEEIHARMTQLDPDIIKLVTMAKTPTDFIRLLKIADAAPIPTIAFCMGPMGVASRVLCGRYGAPFTYSTARAQRQVAPGQLSFQQMKDLYRYDAINRETRVFGVVGDAAVNDPALEFQNTFFARQNANCVSIPLQSASTAPNDLKSAVAEWDWLGLSGMTIACRQQAAALPLGTATDPVVQDADAADTLVRDAERWHAHHSLSEILLPALRKAVGESGSDATPDLTGKTALILGAGTLARIVAAIVKSTGVGVTFSNRTHDRAISLAETLSCQQTPWSDRDLVEPDLLINCTPIGGPTDKDDTPFLAKFLDAKMIVMDFAESEQSTQLIREARQAGCATVTASDLAAQRQACQLRYLTGQPVAPADLSEVE